MIVVTINKKSLGLQVAALQESLQSVLETLGALVFRCENGVEQ